MTQDNDTAQAELRRIFGQQMVDKADNVYWLNSSVLDLDTDDMALRKGFERVLPPGAELVKSKFPTKYVFGIRVDDLDGPALGNIGFGHFSNNVLAPEMPPNIPKKFSTISAEDTGAFAPPTPLERLRTSFETDYIRDKDGYYVIPEAILPQEPLMPKQPDYYFQKMERLVKDVVKSYGHAHRLKYQEGDVALVKDSEDSANSKLRIRKELADRLDRIPSGNGGTALDLINKKALLETNPLIGRMFSSSIQR